MATIDYLSRVFNVLLDPSKTVVDDTSLQRLLLYCSDLSSPKGILAGEEGVKCIMGFLESCAWFSSETPVQSALTFALQLVCSVSSNPDIFNRLLRKDGGTERGLLTRLLQRALEPDMFSEPHVREAWLQLLNKISNSSQEFWEICIHTDALGVSLDLLEDSSMFVMKAAQQFLAKMITIQYMKATSSSSLKDGEPLTMFSQDSTSASKAKMNIENNCSSALGNETAVPKCTGQDAGDIAGEALAQPPVVFSVDSSITSNPNSSFSTHGENASTRLHVSDGNLSVPTSESNQLSISPSSTEARKRPSPDSDTNITDDTSDGRRSVQSGPKKQRLQEKPGQSDIEVQEIKEMCAGVMRSEEMATVLSCLLLDLQPFGHVQTCPTFPAIASNQHEKSTLASIGVLRLLLNDQSPKVGDENNPLLKERKGTVLSLLDDITMVTRCRRLLGDDTQLTDRMCDDVVEFLCSILGHKSEIISSSSTLKLLCDLESLSCDLIRQGFVRPAIHLASGLFRLCSIMSQRSNENISVAACQSVAVIASPVAVVLGEKLLSPSDVVLDDETVTELRALMHDGKTALPFLSTSLSSLHDLVKENHDLQTLCGCDVLHMAVSFLHAVTVTAMLGDQSEGLHPPYRSLIGCRRIVISLLDLSHSALKVNPCKSDVWDLLKILNLIFKNPDAESRILMKILNMLADLLALALSPEDGDFSNEETGSNNSVSRDLGYALQKCMCNMEWEVRDSAIACVHKLLAKKSDKMNEWLELNNLHKRLWESLVDGESYVRATSLQALPVLMGNKALWEDVLRGAHITQLDVLNQVADIICSDSEAFARRAAINCTLTLLKEEGTWLRDGVQSHVSKIANDWASSGISQDVSSSRPLPSSRICVQEVTSRQTKSVALDHVDSFDSSACIDDQGNSTNQPDNGDDDKQVGQIGSDPQAAVGDDSLILNQSVIGTKVLQVIACAVQDLDWEVKIAALSFLETLMMDNILGFGCATLDTASQDNGQFAEARHLNKTQCVDTGISEVSNANKASSDEDMMAVINKTVEVPSGSDRTQQCKGSFGPPRLEDCIGFLLGTGCLKMLVEASEDEDTSVNYKAFVMLQQLKDTLEPITRTSETSDFDYIIETSTCAPEGKDMVGSDLHQSSTMSSTDRDIGQVDLPGKESCDSPQESSFPLIGQLFSTNWTSRLRHREEDNVEGPVSLMMDIVAAAGDHDENLLDCY